MKRTSLVLVITLALLLLVLAAPVSAAAGQPPAGGSCPAGFDELHEFMVHEGEEAHHHIGLHADLNGNGMICVKHLANGRHVHVDDVLQ